MAHNWHPATVVKIPNGCSIKIFENEKYEETLCSRLRNGYEDAYNLGTVLWLWYPVYGDIGVYHYWIEAYACELFNVINITNFNNKTISLRLQVEDFIRQGMGCFISTPGLLKLTPGWKIFYTCN